MGTKNATVSQNRELLVKVGWSSKKSVRQCFTCVFGVRDEQGEVWKKWALPLKEWNKLSTGYIYICTFNIYFYTIYIDTLDSIYTSKMCFFLIFAVWPHDGITARHSGPSNYPCTNPSLAGGKKGGQWAYHFFSTEGSRGMTCCVAEEGFRATWIIPQTQAIIQWIISLRLHTDSYPYT